MNAVAAYLNEMCVCGHTHRFHHVTPHGACRVGEGTLRSERCQCRGFKAKS